MGTGMRRLLREPSDSTTRKERRTTECETRIRKREASGAMEALVAEAGLRIDGLGALADLEPLLRCLTPPVLEAQPALLERLAQGVVQAFKTEPHNLARAMDLCCRALVKHVRDLPEWAPPAPWIEEADAALVLWIERTPDLALDVARALLAGVADVGKLAQAFPAANKAYNQALGEWRSRQLNLGAMPDDVINIVVGHLDPDRDPLQRQVGRLAVASAEYLAYRGLAGVNKRLSTLMRFHLRKSGAARLGREFERLVARRVEAREQIRPLAEHTRLDEVLAWQLSVWGPSIWNQLAPYLPLVLSNPPLREWVSVKLLAAQSRDAVLSAFESMLASVESDLERYGVCRDLTERMALEAAPRYLLGLAYQYWVAPDDWAFKRLLDALMGALPHMATSHQKNLLLELAALVRGDGERTRRIDDLLETRPSLARHSLLKPCLCLVRGTTTGMSPEDVSEALKEMIFGMLDEAMPLALALAIKHAAHVPGMEAHGSMLRASLLSLLADRTRKPMDAPRPHRYDVVLALFKPGAILDSLEVSRGGARELLKRLLTPTTHRNLPLWQAWATWPGVGEDERREWVKAAMADTVDDTLRDALQKLLPPAEPENPGH